MEFVTRYLYEKLNVVHLNNVYTSINKTAFILEFLNNESLLPIVLNFMLVCVIIYAYPVCVGRRLCNLDPKISPSIKTTRYLCFNNVGHVKAVSFEVHFTIFTSTLRHLNPCQPSGRTVGGLI